MLDNAKDSSLEINDKPWAHRVYLLGVTRSIHGIGCRNLEAKARSLISGGLDQNRIDGEFLLPLDSTIWKVLQL